MKRLTNKTYVLSVEGKTEELYFNHLKKLINDLDISKRKANCQFEPPIRTNVRPKEIVKTNTGFIREFYHIQDIEDYDDPDLKTKFLNLLEEINNLKKNNYKFKLGYSNYSFELWILLHKAEGEVVNKRSKYLSLINNAYNTKYKSMKDLKRDYETIINMITLDDIYEAIRRAKLIRENNKLNKKPICQYGYKFYKDNPDLDVHEIVEKILKDCIK